MANLPDLFPSFPLPLNSVLLFGLILLIGLIGGRIAAATRLLPAITGYIATGFLLGPGGLNWLTEQTLADTRIFVDISLGLVVFELGRRLDLEWVRHDRWLLPTGLAESALGFIAMYGVLAFFGIPRLEAAVAAIIGTATAPAVVLLVATELNAEGPVTRRALWIVALNNIVAMLGVTFLMPFIQARYATEPWHPIVRALYVLGASFLLGYASFRIGLLVARLVGKRNAPQFILIVSMIVLTVGAVQALKVSVLLALLTLGVCARNLDRKHVLIDVEFGYAAELFFIVLFVLTGATLRPDQFGSVAWLGLAFIVARAIGKTAALFIFARPARLSVRQTSALSLTLLPMAGLAIGMTQPIYEIAPEFGREIATIVASGLAILHLLGPIATRYALTRSGDAEETKRA